MPRLVVLEGHTQAQADAVAAHLAADGSTLVPGWRRSERDADVVHVGAVSTPQESAAAVLAAVRGANLVINASGGSRELIDRLCDDLRRLGVLDHRVGADPGPPLEPVQRELLGLLLGGATLGQVSRVLHLSRRTTDRRLAAAREALGARSTAEAVAIAGRLGIRPRASADASPPTQPS